MGVEVIGAANDTPETNKATRERYDLPFMLLSDENARVAEAYGALHHNEPRDRRISLVSVFLIESAEHGGRVAWQYIGPTARNRVAFSRLSEEIQNMLGRKHQIVSVVVPSQWEMDRMIADFQDPPLGVYNTPEDLNEPGVLVYRDYTKELVMQSHAEVQRLTEEGWRLAAVSPEYEGSIATGQRYVFERTVE